MVGGTNFAKRPSRLHSSKDHLPHTYEITVIIYHFMGSCFLRLEMGLTKGPTKVRVNKYYLGVFSVRGNK